MNRGVYPLFSRHPKEVCTMNTMLLLAVVAMLGVICCVLLIAFEWARSKKVADDKVIGRSTQQGWASSSKDSAVVDKRRRTY